SVWSNLPHREFCSSTHGETECRWVRPHFRDERRIGYATRASLAPTVYRPISFWSPDFFKRQWPAPRRAVFGRGDVCLHDTHRTPALFGRRSSPCLPTEFRPLGT